MVRMYSVALMAIVVSGTVATAQSRKPISETDSASLPVPQVEGAKEQATIAIFESFSAPGISAVVRRTKGNSGKVLIAVKRSALSVELLSAIFNSVPTSKAAVRVDAVRNDRLFFDGDKLRPVPLGARADLEATLNQLTAASLKEVPGFGKHPAITKAL